MTITPTQQAVLTLVRKYYAAFPVALIMGFIETESSFNPHAFLNDRNGGSYGLMQLDYQTACDRGYRGPAQGLYDPETNIKYGVAQLAWIRDYLKGRGALGLQAVIAAYNEGVGNVLRGNPDPRYVGKVMDAYSRWRIALGEGVT